MKMTKIGIGVMMAAVVLPFAGFADVSACSKTTSQEAGWRPEGWTSGEDWLEQNFVKAWLPAIKDGTHLFVGEMGCHQVHVPHATYLAWLEDVLKVCKRRGWGWTIWNLDGGFGILDTSRTDCEFEDFHGHKLDRKALDLLLKYGPNNAKKEVKK